jgi:hypothetical protein
VELETDANGIVTFLPVATWGVFTVQDKLVGLAFDYYATAADAAALRPTHVQLHLESGAAAALADSLARHAEAVKGQGG